MLPWQPVHIRSLSQQRVGPRLGPLVSETGSPTDCSSWWLSGGAEIVNLRHTDIMFQTYVWVTIQPTAVAGGSLVGLRLST